MVGANTGNVSRLGRAAGGAAGELLGGLWDGLWAVGWGHLSSRVGAQLVPTPHRLRRLTACTPSSPLPPTARLQREDIDRMFKEVVGKWGQVDVLVNNAVRVRAGCMGVWGVGKGAHVGVWGCGDVGCGGRQGRRRMRLWACRRGPKMAARVAAWRLRISRAHPPTR